MIKGRIFITEAAKELSSIVDAPLGMNDQMLQAGARAPGSIGRRANLRTKILDFGGLDSNMILIVRCGIIMPMGFSRNYESISLSRDNISSEIGRGCRVLAVTLREICVQIVIACLMFGISTC